MGFRQFRPVKLTFNTPTSTPALAREEAPIVPKKVVGTEGNDGIGLADSLRPAEVHGGMGKDTIIGTAFSDTLYGDWGDDTIFAGRGDDKVYGGQGEDSLFGGEGNDTLFGGDDGDEINGGAGNDTLFGEQGGDHLLGGEGNDWLFGGQGNDVLTGGKGTDWLWGGEGKDSFRFHLAHDGIIPLDGQKGGALDQIMDFSVGDRIELWIDRRILGDSFDNCWGHVQIQSGADLSDARRGLVFDETTDTLYFDAGSTGFAIAQVHGSVPPTISSIDVVFL